MERTELATLYREYIACLNRQDWASLDRYVAGDVEHNGRQLGVAGYQAMLENDFETIPDLRFNIQLLVVDPLTEPTNDAPCLASRLAFDCHPKATFLGLAIDGKRVLFAENVFYTFRDGKIAHVWSVIDKSAIEAQL